jgi:hypothetical protein
MSRSTVRLSLVTLIVVLPAFAASCASMKQQPQEPRAKQQTESGYIKTSSDCEIVSVDGRPTKVANHPWVTTLPMVVVEPGKHQFTISGPRNLTVESAAVVEPNKDYVVEETVDGVSLIESPPLDNARLVAASATDARARIDDSNKCRYHVVAVDLRPATCSSFRFAVPETVLEVAPGKHELLLRYRGELLPTSALIEPGKEYCAGISDCNCFGPPIYAYVRERQAEELSERATVHSAMPAREIRHPEMAIVSGTGH